MDVTYISILNKLFRNSFSGLCIRVVAERIPQVQGDQTAVFWDVNTCPCPEGLNPDTIYEKVESKLNRMDTSGEMSIWAYVDANEPSWGDLLREKTWKSRIYFLPAGEFLFFYSSKHSFL